MARVRACLEGRLSPSRVLSHAAIASREYVIPAIVGTQVSTRKIPDGALVTLDGAQGMLRIED